MMKKGQRRITDEFAWVIIGAVVFVLVITMIFTATTARPLLEPKSDSFTLAKGDSHTFSIVVRSQDGGKMSNVTLTSQGEIKDWISFDRDSFDVVNSTTVKVKVQVPSSAILKTYTGGIKAETTGGSSLMSLSVIVANQSMLKLESRPIFLGDFEIRRTRGSETLATKENVEITKGTFSESQESFSIPFPADKSAITTSAQIEILVTETNKEGNLIVEFNGVEIYSKKTDAGKIVIPLEKSILNTTNIVGVRSTGPSPFKFWSSSVYKLEKINFVINIKDVEERERSFELTNDEAENFRYFVLQGGIKEHSQPLEELVIKINNQIVYSERPPVVFLNQTVTKDILGNRLVVGRENKISFSFEKDAFLNIDDAFIIVYSS